LVYQKQEHPLTQGGGPEVHSKRDDPKDYHSPLVSHGRRGRFTPVAFTENQLTHYPADGLVELSPTPSLR
jgi:hypothetical protein